MDLAYKSRSSMTNEVKHVGPCIPVLLLSMNRVSWDGGNAYRLGWSYQRLCRSIKDVAMIALAFVPGIILNLFLLLNEVMYLVQFVP